MTNINFVSVGGFGASGGTAIRAIVREINNFHDIGTEFRLIKDPYGIMDLEEKLVHFWRGQLKSDIAIKDFLWLTKNLNRKSGKLKREGFNYENLISKYFLKHTEEYITFLTDFTYKAKWHLLRFKDGFLSQLINKYAKRLFNLEKLETINYSHPSEELFLKATKKYLSNMFRDTLDKKNKTHVMLHNGVPTIDAKIAFRYFDSIKMIIVDRDPRDTFTDIINRKINWFLGEKMIKNYDAQLFVDNFKARRIQLDELKNDNRVLILRFEDLVLNYENVLPQIYKFLEVSEKNHTNKYEIFKPNESKKNIGQWKNFVNQGSISYIKENLHEFCFND